MEKRDGEMSKVVQKQNGSPTKRYVCGNSFSIFIPVYFSWAILFNFNMVEVDGNRVSTI